MSKSRPLEERFWEKVDKSGDCWLWTSALSKGYGQFAIDGVQRRAHRLAYTWLVGPIPEGLSLDHLCHGWDATCNLREKCPHRRCVNPAHLEPVPRGVNAMRGHGPWAENARKTHCLRGHELAGENLYLWHGHRICRACHKLADQARAPRRRQQNIDRKCGGVEGRPQDREFPPQPHTQGMGLYR